VTTSATTAPVGSRRSGAYQPVRLGTVDAAGESVATTWFGMIYEGLNVAGDDGAPIRDGLLTVRTT